MERPLPTLFFLFRLPKSVQAIALWPVVLVKSRDLSSSLIQHEHIHLRQQIELGVFLFYAWYVLEWLIKSIFYRSWFKGYRSISFEREAYENEKIPQYLKKRSFWAFIKYL